MLWWVFGLPEVIVFMQVLDNEMTNIFSIKGTVEQTDSTAPQGETCVCAP